MLTIESLTAEMKPQHNDIGIVHDGDLVRLVGIADDEMDFYYIGVNCHGERTWYSCVGAFESLKGKIRRYDILDNVFAMNLSPRTDTFEIDISRSDRNIID
jgi:hypothetical protein